LHLSYNNTNIISIEITVKRFFAVRDNIGQKIKEIRQSLHLRQGPFAEKIGIRQGYLSEIEAGKKIPGAAVILSLKRNFPEIDLDFLVDNEVKSPIKQPENSRSTPGQQDESLRGFYRLEDGTRRAIDAIGSRMTPDSIVEGDLLIIEKSIEPEEGDYVLVKVDDAPAIVKWKDGDPPPIGVLIKLTRNYK
jgi:transcriptional regulator with XRE-family HTH domain